MNYQKETGNFVSSQGTTDITYYVYKPLEEPVAMLQISHGMCEYVERYEPFIDFLARHRILVFGNNHLGHKGSVQDGNAMGFMAHRDGWKCMCRDVIFLGKKMKEQYPHLKLFLMGHSMGSFIARSVVADNPEIYSGAAFLGTGGKNPMLKVGKRVIKGAKAVKGERYRSPLLTKLIFGNYNAKYENPRTMYDWLTRDEKVVDAYLKDENCTFVFTVSGYENLLAVNEYANSQECFEKIPVDMPVFLLSGDGDPVGNWGDGIREVDERFRKKGMKDYTMKLYPGMRHELLNEIGKEEVYQDLLEWLQQHI